MPFRCKQKFRPAGYVPVTATEQVTLESGELIDRSIDLTKEKLPEPELFDLKNQLKAGVNLEEVSSTVIRRRRVKLDSAFGADSQPSPTSETETL